MRFILAALCFAIPSAATAQSGCGGATQIELTFCAKERWEIADAQLNALWRVAKPAADRRGRGQALLNAQRAWISYRDSSCEPELNSDGSAAQMFYWSCMEEMTLARNKELRAMAR